MNNYDDIIDLPHHISASRPRMSMENRAAQFAPFSALDGHKEAINETSRYTSEPMELTEDEQKILSRRLSTGIERSLPVEITYFVNDRIKSGGYYKKVKGVIKSVDEYSGSLLLDNGLTVRLIEIKSITGDL